MRQKKSHFRHEALLDSEAARDLLAAITDGLDKGRLVFSDEADRIVMKPEGLLNLRVTASQDERQDRVSIRITWQPDQKRKTGKKKLSVSSD